MFPRSVAINVVLSGDETQGVGNNKMIVRKIIKLKTDVTPLRPTMLITEYKLVQKVREALGENIYQKWDIFTDGASFVSVRLSLEFNYCWPFYNLG